MKLQRYDGGDETDPTHYPHEDGDWYKAEDVDKLLKEIQDIAVAFGDLDVFKDKLTHIYGICEVNL